MGIVFIWTNLSKACWLTDEGSHTTTVLEVLRMNGSCMESVWMLISIPSVSLESCEMSWDDAAVALAPLCGGLNPALLLKPFLLM